MKKPNASSLRCLSIAMLLSLSLLLTGCVSVPSPNESYLQDCSISYLKDGPVKNSDVVELAEAREFDVRKCNLDKQALRAWYTEMCKGVRRVCTGESR